MKVGLLTTSFPRHEGDIPGVFVLGFARALAARGHSLCVLAPEPDVPQPKPSFEGIELRWLRYLPRQAWQRTFYGAGVLDNLRATPLAALGLVPFVGALARAAHTLAREVDVLVSHWAVPCALVAGSVRPRLPHLAVLHSADVFVLERLPRAGLWAARIAAGADALLFSSRDLRARFLTLLAPAPRAEVGTRCHVCAMGIEPQRRVQEERAALRERLGLRGLTLLSLGRLIALKGLSHAIDAVRGLAGAELVIAGDGPEAAALRQRAHDAPVRFVGALHGAAKRDWLCAADAFVLPSIVLPSGRTEGMPTSLLEAMEHALPVIASDVGGVSDVVRDGHNGLLLQPADVLALRGAFQRMQDATLREGLRNGARETAALYHWDELGPHLSELLEQCVAERRA